MAGRGAAYEVKPFPISRRLIIDSGRVGRRRHTVSGLLEIDVTEARRIMQTHKERAGEALSFTAFIVLCLGKAIDHNKYTHARRDMLGRLILFDEVDCTTLIEIDFQGQKFPLAHIVRAINKRSYRSIHDEIRAVQANPQSSRSLQYPTWLIGLYLLLPAFLRDVPYGVMARSPQRFKQQAGTVILSAVGMYGAGGGWGLGPGSIYTTGVLLGGISKRPGVVDGQIAVREYLGLTVQFDHDIVDGAPAARFAARFKEFIESAYGLDDFR